MVSLGPVVAVVGVVVDQTDHTIGAWGRGSLLFGDSQLLTLAERAKVLKGLAEQGPLEDVDPARKVGRYEGLAPVPVRQEQAREASNTSSRQTVAVGHGELIEMKRILLVGGLVGALFAGSPASAVILTDGSATGGGFNRVDGPGPGFSDATKRMVTIQATDSDPMGDSGRANWRIHTPRPSESSPSNLKAHITLDCVFVSGDVAYATGSGGGVDYSLRIRDGGEPGKSRDSFGVVEDTGLDALLCMAESEVALEVLWADPNRTMYMLDGGNFRITSSN